MTRPEDVWTPERDDRSTTLRFGSVAAVVGSDAADVSTVTGTTLAAVPIYGPIAVGLRVLLLHDGQKLVGVTDAGPRYATVATTIADGTFTVALPVGLFTAGPIAVATVLTTSQTALAMIQNATTAVVVGKVVYYNAGAWGVAPGFLVHVVITPRTG
jgi:hypothetical protein